MMTAAIGETNDNDDDDDRNNSVHSNICSLFRSNCSIHTT